MYRILRPALALICCALLAMPAGARADRPLQVVASFSILADIASEVGGERVAVSALVGPDEDAHAYQPRPSDARLVREADLIIANGLGFDTWLERLAAAAGNPRPVVIASRGVKAIEDAGHGHHGHDHGPLDPHAWQDVGNVRIYARNIADALIALDQAGEPHYLARLDDFDARLAELDHEIRQRLAGLPDERRKVVTSHDAFGYFTAAYGIRFLPAAGISNQSEISAAGMARLIRQLRREQAPVVFIENISDTRQIERIASESGARVGGALFSDALSAPDGPAPTYIAMMRANLESLASQLAP